MSHHASYLSRQGFTGKCSPAACPRGAMEGNRSRFVVSDGGCCLVVFTVFISDSMVKLNWSCFNHDGGECFLMVSGFVSYTK